MDEISNGDYNINNKNINSSNEPKEDITAYLNQLKKEDLIKFIQNKNSNKEIKQFFKIDNNTKNSNKNSNTTTNTEIKSNTSKIETTNYSTDNNIDLKPKRIIDYNIVKNFAFKFMYMGKNYDGLVTQLHTTNTIENFIFKALVKATLVKNIEDCNYSRCGRTDAGVSAIGNVFNATLRYKDNLDYQYILNKILPRDIRIIGQSEVDETFDSRFSCLYREYKYYFVKNNMNIDKIKEGVKKLKGTHNYKNFCKIDKSDKSEKEKNFERRIYEFKVEKVDNEFMNLEHKTNEKTNENGIFNDYFEIYVATIKGSAFLWHQVRCMMSILFLIGQNKEELSIIDKLFDVDNVENKIGYEIASDFPLVLTDCQFENIDFGSTVQNSSNLYYDFKKIYEESIINMCLTSHFFKYFGNQIKNVIHIKSNNQEIQHYNKQYITKYFELKHPKHANKYTKIFEGKDGKLLGNKRNKELNGSKVNKVTKEDKEVKESNTNSK